MGWFYYFYYILIVLSVVIALYSLYVGCKSKSSRSQVHFVLSMFAISILNFSYFLLINVEELESMIIAAKVGYFAKILCVLMLTDFVLTYCNADIPRWFRLVEWFYHLIMLFFMISFDYNHFFFSRAEVGTVGGIPVLLLRRTSMYGIFLLNTFIMFLIVITEVVKKLAKSKIKRDQKKYQTMLIGCVTPMLGLIYNAFHIFHGLDLLPINLTFSCISFLYIIRKYNLFDLSQNAKEYVLDHADEAVVVLNTSLEVMYFNHEIKKIYPEIEMFQKIDSKIFDFFAAGNTQFQMEGTIYEYHKTELYRDDGRLEGFMLEVQDITENQNTIQEMTRLMVDAEIANQAKSSFLANMSHGIRTPINAILGMDEMIIRESQNDMIIEYAENIGNAGKTLLSIINDILDFSKIENGRLEIVPAVYEIEQILENSKNLIEPRLENKGLEFTCEVDDNVPSKLFGDQNRVQQIITNVLTNAVKYTEKGGVWLRVSAHDLGEKKNKKWVQLVVSIKDTGKGIKEEDLAKLFQSFQRVDEERNRNIEGTGLGLPITQKLLEQMGGAIEVESEYNKGSEFTILLPQAVIDATPYTETQKQKDSVKGKKAKYQARFVAPNAKVLVVDDNAVNLKVFCALLKQTKVQITALSSGQKAIDEVQRNRYDLIFLDHMMPEMDGIETLHKMQKLEHNLCLGVPIIVLTANAIQGAKEMYLSAGFEDYMMKPIDTTVLEKMIIQYLPKELVELKE